MSPQDHTVIHRHGHFQVLRQAYLVTWPNGSSIGLHLVNVDGHPAQFLRCLLDDSLHAVVFDLRDVCHGLGTDLTDAYQRDVAGIIAFTLRGQFTDARQCSNTVMANFRAAWLYPAHDRPAAAPASVHHPLAAAA